MPAISHIKKCNDTLFTSFLYLNDTFTSSECRRRGGGWQTDRKDVKLNSITHYEILWALIWILHKKVINLQP